MDNPTTPDDEQFDVVITVGDDNIVDVTPTHPAKGYAFENGAFIWHNGMGDTTPVSCEAIAENLNNMVERAHRAEASITDYSDHRLEDMWREAGAIADRAGHCSVYDDLVRELGGLPRERTYIVTVPVNGYVSVVVTASSAEEAEEYARDMADVDDAHDLELDWYNAEAQQD